MAIPKYKPRCVEARQWLAQRNGKHCLGPFTGFTSRVFSGYVHLVDAWLNADDNSRHRLEVALREIAACLQGSEWKLAAEVVANIGDWCHVEELWEKIKPNGAPSFYYDEAIDKVVEFEHHPIRRQR